MISDSAGEAGEVNAWLRTGMASAGNAVGTGPASDFAVLAADADRDHTADALVSALAEGRVTKEEFSARAGRALGARTHGELAAVLSGLPATGHRSPAACQAPDPAARRPCGRSLLLWALAELGWAAATLALHHRWPSNLAVRAVLLAGFLALTASTARCAWRVMSGY